MKKRSVMFFMATFMVLPLLSSDHADKGANLPTSSRPIISAAPVAKISIDCDIQAANHSIKQSIYKQISQQDFNEYMEDFLTRTKKDFPGDMDWSIRLEVSVGRSSMKVFTSKRAAFESVWAGDIEDFLNPIFRHRRNVHVILDLEARPIDCQFDDRCAICLEESGKLVHMSCCRNIIHRKCLLRSMYSGDYCRCPICRDEDPDFQ